MCSSVHQFRLGYVLADKHARGTFLSLTTQMVPMCNGR